MASSVLHPAHGHALTALGEEEVTSWSNCGGAQFPGFVIAVSTFVILE
jgi:hypothetical protein